MAQQSLEKQRAPKQRATATATTAASTAAAAKKAEKKGLLVDDPYVRRTARDFLDDGAADSDDYAEAEAETSEAIDASATDASTAAAVGAATVDAENGTLDGLTDDPEEIARREAQYKREALAVVQRFLAEEQLDELIEDMGKLKSAHGNADAVRRLIRASMDHRPAKRELTSRALVGLASAKVVSLHAISAAFSRLLDDLDDVTKDVPAAGKMLSTFMARAVVDDCLPPAFLSDERFDAAGTVVRDARLLLTVPARTVRLSHAWGFAMEDVDTLKHYVRLLVEEFMSTGDGVEAAQCVRELDAPLFMHELVKRAVVLAIDKSEELQMLVSDLLQYLVITLQLFGKREVSIGFHRVRAELDSLTLDAPSAPTVFNEFVERAIADDILPASFPEDDFAEAAASNPFAAEAAAVAAAAAEEAGEDETEASAAQ